MTREEARNIIRDIWNTPKTQDSNTDFYIDMLVRFGVLKLDESKTIEQKAQEALETRVTPLMAKTCLETLAAWNFGLMKK